jgi:nifR3 family TIM-barrel protein
MLKIGNLCVKTPVMLAPMADYTNLPYRLLCNSFSDGFFVNEMLSTKAILNTKKPLSALIDTNKKENIRSVQLYVLKPLDAKDATKKVLDGGFADHIDLNFGCPVRKVTRIGGGSAILWKIHLYSKIISDVKKVCESFNVPLTVKIRKGIDNYHITYLENGKIAESEGANAVILHARTTNQYYHGNADWNAIKKLKETIKIPVIGNGDVCNVYDFAKMLKETKCDGIAIGRAALGRPHFFGQIKKFYKDNISYFENEKYNNCSIKNDEQYNKNYFGRPDNKPDNKANNNTYSNNLKNCNNYKKIYDSINNKLYYESISIKDIIKNVKKHLELVIKYTNNNEYTANKLLRKFYIYYFKGANIGGNLRSQLASISSNKELYKTLDKIIDKVGDNAIINENFMRGRQGNMHKVYLPDGWLDNKF